MQVVSQQVHGGCRNCISQGGKPKRTSVIRGDKQIKRQIAGGSQVGVKIQI